MATVQFNTVDYEPMKIELPKKMNKMNRSYNTKNMDYNNQLEVSSDLNGIISSTPPSGFFMETLKNRMDVYFSGNLRFPEPLPQVR